MPVENLYAKCNWRCFDSHEINNGDGGNERKCLWYFYRVLEMVMFKNSR